jgi:cytosine/adenosine deaminase-related metal-dependent hydrolase
VKHENDLPLLLSGRIVYPDGGARFRYVLVRSGRVEWVGVSRPPEGLARGAREVVAGPRGWVFPGLINLHTHAAYNVLPLWYSRKAPFDNRFDWRADADYRADISARLAALKTRPGAEQTLAVVAELQAIAGGTTVLDQSNRLDANAPPEHPIVLCRDTGDTADLGLPADRRVDSIVDFFFDDHGTPSPKIGRDGNPLLDTYAADRDAGRLAATLAHLAEGRSGVGSGRGADAYSRAEFQAFMQHPALQDAARVRAVPLSLVHCCGLDAADPAQTQFLANRNISIIWSPVSNLLLYGDTLDVERLRQHGINVALGSDWSPSGSKHVWDEAKFARRYLAAIGSAMSDADVFRMVTVNASRCLGSRALGRIEEGACADLFIIESPIDSDSALEVFFSAEDRDVLATIVNGVPIYGRRAFLEQFELPLQALPAREGSAARDKAVHLPPEVQIDVAGAIDAIEDHLKSMDPPVQRSNLLASSDKPYQRRLQRLRGHVESFAWSARQTAKQLAKGTPPMNGRVPVPPGAIRVWCGFRMIDTTADALAPVSASVGTGTGTGTGTGAGVSASVSDRFLDRLGSVFVPSTVMLLRELGLTAYVPAVAPAEHPPGCPDTVAIACYESQAAYDESLRSVGGRLYALLHDSMFRSGARGSWEAFPEPLPAAATVTAVTPDAAAAGGPAAAASASLRPRAAYHLFDDAIDWYGGLTRLCVGLRDPAQDAAAFRAQLLDVCLALRAAPGPVDGAILAVDDDYFSFWDHRASAGPAPAPALAPTPAPKDDAHLQQLAGFARIVMQTQAADVCGNGQLFESWSGLPLAGGECYRLTFERRAFFPW